MSAEDVRRDGDLAEVWVHQRVWSLTASRLKTRIDRAQSVGLLLGIVAAIVAVLAVQLAGVNAVLGATLSATAGVAAGLVPFALRRAGTDHIRDWTRARSASEGLKSEVFQYLGGSSAYHIDAQRRLLERSEEIRAAMADLLRETLGISADDKPVPDVADADSYLAHRVTEEVKRYYCPRAEIYQKRVKRLRFAGELLAALAVVLGVVAASTGVEGVSAWVPVVTTVAASLIAHITASRYDHQIVEFLRTAEQLDSIAASHARGDLSDAQLVDECERVISVENQSWMTQWNKLA